VKKMLRTIAVIQARMSSTRLPGKVLKPICGKPMLQWQLERVAACRLLDMVIVATSNEPSDDPLEALCLSLGVPCFRGSLNDVLGRFHGAAVAHGPATHVVRLTGDCPLTDPALVDACVALHIANGADYTSNGLVRTYPDGLDVEVMTFAALERAGREATTPFQREHVTPFINLQPQLFAQDVLRTTQNLELLRWTVDNPADFIFAERVFTELLPVKPAFSWLDVLQLVTEKPEIAAINSA
jgi:spore coat polysaccharide biosynthesis protein SpsF